MNTRKICINVCFGGFGLSPEALQWLYVNGKTDIAMPVDEYFRDTEDHGSFSKDNSLKAWKEFMATGEGSIFLTVFTPDLEHVLTCSYNLTRDDPLLIQCVEALGAERASARLASLKIVEIPADVVWRIHDYDGNEHVEESHRTWS